jgi:hypothetical protein
MTARKRATPKVGIFFVVDGKHPFVDGIHCSSGSPQRQ